MLTTIILFLLCSPHTRIALAASSKLLCVTVEDLLISARKRKSDLIFLMKHRRKVADKEQCFFRLVCLSCKDNDIICRRGTVDPFEALLIKILLIHGRIRAVKLI